MTASEDQLRALMGHALSGDARAHEAVLKSLAPVLGAYFGRRLRDAAHDVDDLVQESLIAIHSRRASYDPSRPFMAWVYAIARYKLADHFRRSKKTARHEALDEAHAAVEFEEACAARMDVDRLLTELSSKQQMAIRATKIEGESVSDVAAAHRLTEADVKVSVHRGLKALAARFGGGKA